jgi:signal transduction histidine kinase
MELHRGTISIQSAPQIGTTVTCRFPPGAAV